MCLPSCDLQINVLKKGLNVKAARRPSANKLRKKLAKVMPKVANSKEESEDDEGWLEEVDPDQNGEQQREQIEVVEVERAGTLVEGADEEGAAEEGAAEEGADGEGSDEEGADGGVQDAVYDADAEEESGEQQTTSF